MNEKLPLWYEIDGMISCQSCRKKSLEEFGVHMRGKVGEDEIVRSRDFMPLGRRPWAGNDPGDRYMQCDFCNGQWGPDA